jgi:TP901 family phage tail tape measure protein
MASRESKLIVSLMDRVSGPSRKVLGSLNRISHAASRMNSMRVLPGAASSASVTRFLRNTAIMAGAYIGVSKAMDGTLGAARKMQAALTEIGIKADLSQGQLGQLLGQMTSLSGSTNQTTADLLGGVDAMVTLGLDANRAAAAMPAIGKAATATMSSVTDLSAASVAAMQNMRVTPGEIAKMLDAMAEAGNQGAFEMRDMAREFPALTASAKSLGIEGVQGITDMAAALQIARRGAGDASTAANNMANFLQKIMSPQTIKNFRKFGIDATKELQKAHKKGISPIEHFIGLVDKATKGGRADLLGQLFGDKQVMEFVRPMLADFKDYLKIRGDAERASGTVAAAYKQRMQAADERLRAFSIRLQNLGQSLGAQMLDPLGKAAEHLAGILDTLGNRATIIDKLQAAFDGLAHGAGFKDATAAITQFGQAVEKFLFGDPKEDAALSLGRIFKKFDEWGQSVRRFTDAIKDNPIARFVGDMAGYGFQLMLASSAIGVLASALWKLGRAAAFLSGLTAVVGIVKGLGRVGGLLAGAGTAAATAGKTVPAGASAATAAGTKVVEKAGTRAAGRALVETGKRSTERTLLAETAGKLGASAGLLGRAATRILGLPSIAAEVTTRALLDTPPADLRLIDPEYAPRAYRKVEDRNADRQQEPAQLEAPKVQKPKPFSFKGLWQDLMSPIKPTIDGKAVDDFVKKSDLAGEAFKANLEVVARPTIDTSSIDQALTKVSAFSRMLSAVGSATPTTDAPKFGGPRARGGPVKRGVTYLVGEEGPEPFTPGADGYISPHSALEDDAPAPRRRSPIERGLNYDIAEQADSSDAGNQARQAIKGGDTTINNSFSNTFHVHGGNAEEVVRKMLATLNRQLTRSNQTAIDGRGY